MGLKQSLSDLRAINTAILNGGINAGMRKIAELDQSLGLRERFNMTKDPFFAEALKKYNAQKLQEHRAIENSQESVKWYRRRLTASSINTPELRASRL